MVTTSVQFNEEEWKVINEAWQHMLEDDSTITIQEALIKIINRYYLINV